MYGVRMWIEADDFSAVPYYKEIMMAKRFGAG